MKLAGQKALAFCERPGRNHRIALVFGSDSGLVSQAVQALCTAWLGPSPDPMNVVRLGDDDLKRDELVLADQLVARSLLGGDRLVRLSPERDASVKLAIAALEQIDASGQPAEAFWIVEAGDLARSHKLRQAFEASASAMALQLFADDLASIRDYVLARLTAEGVRIAPDALSAFCAELPGDRRLAAAESEKLALYALGLDRAISLDDVRAISSAEQDAGADDAADAALAGQPAATVALLIRFLDGGGSAISALRTLQFRLMRVLDAAATQPVTGMKLRPPVFDREWPAFRDMMRNWSVDRAAGALAAVYDAEKACKLSGPASEAVVSELFDRVARTARKR